MSDKDDNKPLGDAWGTIGFNHSGGFVNEEFLPNLRWPNAARIYKEMGSNDDVASTMIFGFRQLIRKSRATVNTGGDSEQALESFEFIQSVMSDIDQPFADIMAELSTMFQFGFCIMEMLYKKSLGEDQADPRLRSKFNDGKWRLRKLAPRNQETIYKWDINKLTDEIDGCWQQSPNDFGLNYIPKSRFLHFKLDPSRGNPESQSGLRAAYRAYHFKKRIENYEAIGLEHSLVGVPIITCPKSILDAGASESDIRLRAYLKRSGRNLRNNSQAFVLLPSDPHAETSIPQYDIKLVKSAGGSAIDTNTVILRWARAMARTTFMDFVLMGASGNGSNAQHTDKSTLFQESVNAYLGHIEGVFNEQMIPELLSINDMSFVDKPKISLSKIDTRDAKAWIDAVNTAVGGGFLEIDPTLEQETRKILEVKQKTSTEDL